ncbi:MAG: hypothetical protein IKU53_05155 [Firmicutes bacterium]|nr:hypothetical protein [Bacillota bacterium]
MLTREDYLEIKKGLVEELFTPFLTDERKQVIKETIIVISNYINEEAVA